MIKNIRAFCRKEDGAITVDWVVLAAGTVALAATAYVSIQDESVSLNANSRDRLQAMEPGGF